MIGLYPWIENWPLAQGNQMGEELASHETQRCGRIPDSFPGDLWLLRLFNVSLFLSETAVTMGSYTSKKLAPAPVLMLESIIYRSLTMTQKSASYKKEPQSLTETTVQQQHYCQLKSLKEILWYWFKRLHAKLKQGSEHIQMQQSMKPEPWFFFSLLRFFLYMCF